jgi:hypothetical protein
MEEIKRNEGTGENGKHRKGEMRRERNKRAK